MPATMNSGGDVLARGGVRATFRQPNVSEEKYNEATQDFDLDKFLGRTPAPVKVAPKKRKK